MDEPQLVRLGKLMERLAQDVAYTEGTRKFPWRVSPDDAADIAALLAGEIDSGCAAREQVAARQGYALACGAGCAGCCEELVLVYLPEAHAVARWLARPENAAAKEAFLRRYDGWKARVGDAPERLAALAWDEKSRAEYDAAHVAQWRQRVPCAFNDGGLCTVYEVRPAVCRNAHAVGTSERCRGDNTTGRPAERLQFKPLDEFVARTQRLYRATHLALGKPADYGALCVLVKRILDGRAAR